MEIALCVLTNDDRSRSGAVAANRVAAIREAAAILGVARVEVHDYGDNQLDTASHLELNRVVELQVRSFEPDTVFTTSMADPSVDHQIASRAARVASRAGRSPVREIRCFEVRSPTAARRLA